MDFSTTNIQEILKHSIPKRFQDMSPSDFEDFVSELFKKLGYKVEQTSYSGDFGADFIAEKNGNKTAVQVKRYAKSNKVGVPDINQVIGAKDYYKCNHSMIITTSDYTNPAIKLLDEANVKYWSWDNLQKNISNAYLDGKDIYQYFPDLADKPSQAKLKFEITKIKYNINMKRIGPCTLIYASLTNNGANTNIALQMPVIITQANQQVEAIYWFQGYFSNGTIYSGASVEVAFMFKKDQLNIVSAGDRIIFNVFLEDGDTQTFDTSVNIASFNGCYIATACYGKNSREYSELTYFRDNFLITNNLGRKVTRLYYKYGGVFLSIHEKSLFAENTFKFIIKTITYPIMLHNQVSARINNRKKKRC